MSRISEPFLQPFKNKKPPRLKEGEKICLKCRGSGQVRFVYGGPMMKNQYRVCTNCFGEGKINEWTAE